MLSAAVLVCVVYACLDCTGVHGQAHNTQHEGQGAMRGVMQSNSLSTAGLLASSFCTIDNPSCQLEDVQCFTDSDCYDVFPNLATAIGMGKIYPQPTAPVCRNLTTTNLAEDKGRCSCKENQCVSYSKKFGSNMVFFYCGPCGFVGSQCASNVNCTHEQSECRGSFCECKKNGEFYEVSYCKIPYVGYETALQIVLIVCVALAACVVLATIYNASPFRKRFGSLRQLCTCSREQPNPQEPPNTDMPPAYDDVVESLPSYQDALQISPVDTNELS